MVQFALWVLFGQRRRVLVHFPRGFNKAQKNPVIQQVDEWFAAKRRGPLCLPLGVIVQEV